MKDTIPFFYYDLIARIAPGVLVLAVCSQLRMRAPVWRWIISGDEGWKTAVVPLLLLGTAYALGSVLEALFRLTTAYNKVSDSGFDAAARKFVDKKLGDSKLMPELSYPPEQKADFRYRVWQHLVACAAEGTAFSQAHRFQADSKLYLHSALPAAVLLSVALFRRFHAAMGDCTGSAATVLFCLVVVLLVVCAQNAEYRRWLQVLAYVEHERLGNPAILKNQ